MKQLAPQLFVPENFAENHHYYADPDGNTEYTGITTVLGVLNKPALVPWAARMTAEHIKTAPKLNVQNCDPIPDELRGLPVETLYCVTESLLDEAITAYAKKRDDAAQKGTDIHAMVEEYVKNVMATPGFVIEQKYEPIRGFINWSIRENIRFLGSEQVVYSPKLFVAGTFDLLFEKDGKTYLGDIKTYKKIYDRTPFFQCAGYSLLYEEMQKQIRDEEIERKTGMPGMGLYHKEIDGYCIINLPKERKFNPEEDVLWSWDIEGDTKGFLACYEIYRQMKQPLKPKKIKKYEVR